MASSLSSNEPPPRPVGHDQIQGTLSAPLLRFDLPREIEHLHRQEAWQKGTGPSSTTLVKHADLRVVLIAMRRDELLPRHRTVARITVHVLSGALTVRLPGEEQRLATGQVLVLDRNLVHDVLALEDSAFLLTLAWPIEEDCP